MKSIRNILTLLLVLVAFNTFAQDQICINYTVAELKERLGSAGWTRDVRSDGEPFWYKQFNNETWYYTNWSAEGKNEICMVDPGSTIRASGMIEHMNKTWVIVNEYQWKLYVTGQIIYAELFWIDSAVYPCILYY